MIKIVINSLFGKEGFSLWQTFLWRLEKSRMPLKKVKFFFTAGGKTFFALQKIKKLFYPARYICHFWIHSYIIFIKKVDFPKGIRGLWWETLLKWVLKYRFFSSFFQFLLLGLISGFLNFIFEDSVLIRMKKLWLEND